MKNKQFLAHIGDLKDGGLVSGEVEGVELIALRSGEDIHVFQGRCPHQGTKLSQGSIAEGKLECAGHGWRFDCVSGAATDHPPVCLQSFPFLLEKDHIWVDVDEVLRWKKQNPPKTAPRSSLSTTKKKLPGPRGIPLLGNMLQIKLNRFHLILEKWYDVFRSPYQFRLGSKTNVVVADPELISEVLQHRPEDYRRIGMVEPVFQEMGIHGIFSSEGETWSRQRRLTTPAFSASHLKNFFGTLKTVTQRLKNRWDKMAVQEQDMDPRPDLMRFTVDVTTHLAFGHDMNTLEKEGDVIQTHLEKIFPAFNRRINALFPYWRYLKLPQDRALDRSLGKVREIVGEIIQRGRERMAAQPSLRDKPTCFLEAFLASSETDRLSDDEIFGNVLTILLAGEDTTANSLAWMMHLMTTHLEVQGKMIEEVDAVMDDESVPLNIEEIDRLKFIEAVIHESMRLKPVAPVIFLEANRDSDLGAIRLRKGTGLIGLLRYPALQEENFTKAEEFLPERWLADRPGVFRNHNTKAFTPFGGGPRFCPGRNLALLEMKTVAAMLCKNFRLVQPANGQMPEEHFAFVMTPMNLWMKFERRV